MSNASFHEQHLDLLQAAQNRYHELRWRLAFLRTGGSEPDPEPTQDQLLDWYKRIPVTPRALSYTQADSEVGTVNQHFAKLFPDQTAQFGPAFLEAAQTDSIGNVQSVPIYPNHDSLAASLSDPRLGLNVVYYESDMQFYYREPFLTIYKPVSAEKLQGLYRGLVLRSANLLKTTSAKLNIWSEFRSDKNARIIIQRAKSILAVSSVFFSPTSKNQRIRGVELHEKVARKFVDDLLTSEPGQILRLADAYAMFRNLLKQRDLPDLKRSEFKAVVAPLIREEFNVALRNDLPGLDGSGVRGWKGVKLLQTAPD